MDHQAAAAIVRRLRDAASRAAGMHIPIAGGIYSAHSPETIRAANAEAQFAVHAASTVARRIGAEGDSKVMSQYAALANWRLVIDACDRVIGYLEGVEALDAALGPKGPQLAASGLHPSVWDTAAKLWDGGHRRGAIQAAAAVVEATIQAKTDRYDVSGKALMGQVFSPHPPEAGKSRLRFSHLKGGSEEWMSAHEGAMHFAMGCSQAIRNRVAHGVSVEPAQDVALECLAALSVLARWVEEMEIDSV